MTAAFPGEHDSGLQVLGDGRHRRGVPARLLRLASDERLVDGVRGGSESAFEALFDRYHRGVLGFCRHMLGTVEEAEDATQHTFLAAYRELVGSTAHVVFRPWVYTIARNRCLTVLRTRARQAGGALVEPPTEHLAAAVERRHDLRELLGDVARLPEDQRSALVLAELGDMSHDEIADVLGCRRDKVKALVFQARTSLIASRSARDASCAEIREQLANLRGGSLRRNELRRHVNECAGCREFRDQVRAQRRDLALVLPVAPTIGLKSAVFGGGVAGSTAAAAAAGGGGGAMAAKILVVAAITGAGTVAVSEEVKRQDPPAPAPAPRSGAPAVRESSPAATGAPATIGRPSVVPLRDQRAAKAPGHNRAKTTPPGHARSKPEHPPHPGAPGLVGKEPKPTKEERDAAKADRQAANDQAKAERNAAKSDRKAARDQAKADRNAAHDQAKADRNAAKTERKSANPGKASKPAKAPKPLKPPKPPQVKAPTVPEPVTAPAPLVDASATPGKGSAPKP